MNRRSFLQAAMAWAAAATMKPVSSVLPPSRGKMQRYELHIDYSMEMRHGLAGRFIAGERVREGSVVVACGVVMHGENEGCVLVREASALDLFRGGIFAGIAMHPADEGADVRVQCSGHARVRCA